MKMQRGKRENQRKYSSRASYIEAREYDQARQPHLFADDIQRENAQKLRSSVPQPPRISSTPTRVPPSASAQLDASMVQQNMF